MFAHRVRVRSWAAACCLCGAALAVSCGSRTERAAEGAAWTYDTNVGIAVVTNESACLAIGNPSLAPNVRVHVVDTAQQHDFPAAIVGARPSCAEKSPGTYGYEIRFEGERLPAPAVGIAVVGGGASFGRRGAELAADIDHDQRQEFFRTCTSSEGVHATIWSEVPLTGPRRWHQYLTLGYDTEATCTPAEVNP